MSNYNPPDPLPPPLTIFNNVNWEVPDVISGGGGGGAGPQGIAGPQGLQGVQGSAGSAGSAGSQGSQGLVGATGVGGLLYYTDIKEKGLIGLFTLSVYDVTIAGSTGDRFRTTIGGEMRNTNINFPQAVITIGITGTSPSTTTFTMTGQTGTSSAFFKIVVENNVFRDVFNDNIIRSMTTMDVASNFYRFFSGNNGGGTVGGSAIINPFQLYVRASGAHPNDQIFFRQFSVEKLSI